MACGDPGGAKCAGTWTVSTAGVMAVSESFFEPLCSWRSEGLFGQSFSIVPHAQALRGLPCLGALCCSGHQGRRGTPPTGVLLCSSVRQTFDGPASLLFSYRCWRVGREAVVMAPPPLQLSSIALLPRLPGFPPPESPTTISSLTSPQSISLQSTAALTLGLFHNP